MTQSINYYIQLSDETSTAIDSMTKEELIYMAFRVLGKYQQHSPYPCKRIYIGLKWFELPNEHLIKLAKGLLDKAESCHYCTGNITMSHSINYYIQLSDETSTIIDGMTKEELIYMAFRVLDTYQQHWAYPCKRIYTYHPLKWFELPNEHLIKLAKGLLDKADNMVV